LFEAWGAEIKWNAAKKEVRLAKKGWKLTLKANAKRTVVLNKGVMYVEAVYLEDAASFLIAHDDEFNAIIISSGP
jgi:site-specific recombinase XerD